MTLFQTEEYSERAFVQFDNIGADLYLKEK